MIKKLTLYLTLIVLSAFFLIFPHHSFALGSFTFTVTNYDGHIYGIFPAPVNYLSALQCTVHAIDESFVRNIACDGVPNNGMLSAGASFNAVFSPGTYYFEFVYRDTSNTSQTIYSYNFDVPPPSQTPTPITINTAPIINTIADADIMAGEIFTTNGSFLDPDSTSWTATVDYGDGSGVQLLALNGMSFDLNHKYATTGKYMITVVIRDNHLGTGIATATVTATVPFSSFIFTVTKYDGHIYGIFPVPDNYFIADRCTVHAADESFIRNIACFDTISVNGKLSAGADYNAVFPPGTYYFEFAYRDAVGGLQSIYSGNFVVSAQNLAPSVNAIFTQSISEGDSYSASGSFIDSDSSSWIAMVDYGDGGGAEPLALNSDKTFFLSHVYKDNGTYVVNITVTDNQGAVGIQTVKVIVDNVTPSVGAINVSEDLVVINNLITATASFSDPGILDNHTAMWNWGDGSTTAGVVIESNGSGTVVGSHVYTSAGIYTVTLLITDNNGGMGSSAYQYLVAYNPAAGFLTGSGQYNSQPVWDLQDVLANGHVKFEMHAKYDSEKTLKGQTKWSSKDGNIDFVSKSYDWLVVNGDKAVLKGRGKINGSGDYTFFATVLDRSKHGKRDLVRFKIMNGATVIYDSQPGAPDTAEPTTFLTNGSIKIH